MLNDKIKSCNKDIFNTFSIKFFKFYQTISKLLLHCCLHIFSNRWKIITVFSESLLPKLMSSFSRLDDYLEIVLLFSKAVVRIYSIKKCYEKLLKKLTRKHLQESLVFLHKPATFLNIGLAGCYFSESFPRFFRIVFL